ncbi:MAG: 5,6-dimethylbenzimidazole synthase [Paraglaciecola psychrophila]|jgi:5,6-dimethylbenzimidazole synthase
MNNKSFSQQDEATLASILAARRDVRGNNFTAKAVSDESLEKILQAASLAPSVGYSQPWEFVLVRDQAIKTQIAASFEEENLRAENTFSEQKKPLYSSMKLEGIVEAPVNIAVFYRPSKGPVLGQNTMLEMGEYSVVCAVQNMWLMSRTMNIGMGWVSILNPETVKNILNAPPENKLIAYLCVGYVETFLDRPELEINQWQSKKPLADAVYHDSY